MPTAAGIELVKFLEYGLLGLSLATLLLAFFIFFKVISQDKIGQNKRKLATTFLFGAFGFFITSGIFYIYQKETPVEVSFGVGSWNLDALKRYGNPTLNHEGVVNLTPDRSHSLKIKNRDFINIDFHEIANTIIKRERRIEFLNLKLALNVQDHYKLKSDVGVVDNGKL